MLTLGRLVLLVALLLGLASCRGLTPGRPTRSATPTSTPIPTSTQSATPTAEGAHAAVPSKTRVLSEAATLTPTTEATTNLEPAAPTPAPKWTPYPLPLTPTIAVPTLATAVPEPTEPPSSPLPSPITAAAPASYPLPISAEAGRSNIGPYLLMNPEAGQPTHNLLKDGHMRGYMAINPAHWSPADQLPRMEGYGRNWIPEEEELEYIRAGAAGARAYYDEFADSYDHCREDIHAWMSTWAFVYKDAPFSATWVEFQVEWLRLMHQNGYRAGVGGMKTHLFGVGDLARLAPAIEASDYIFLSESGAPTIMASRGTTTLLYRELIEELAQVLDPERIPPLILDVCVDGGVLAQIGHPGGPWWQRGYIQFETPKESYQTDVRTYDLETLRDPYVRHVFWFATNITDKTHSFDVNTDMLAAADRWHVGASAQ